jgi:hypothetical protein
MCWDCRPTERDFDRGPDPRYIGGREKSATPVYLEGLGITPKTVSRVH